MRKFAGVPRAAGVNQQWGYLRRHFWAVSVALSSETLETRPVLSAKKDQQESRAMAGKPNDDVVKFYTYRNLLRHRAVLAVIARHSCFIYNSGVVVTC